MAGAKIEIHDKAKTQGFSARFVCMSSKVLSDGTHPIRLQLIHNLKVKRFGIDVSCSKKEWDADNGRVKPRSKNAAEMNRRLNATAVEVGDIVDSLVVHGWLSIEGFTKNFGKPRSKGDVFAAMEAKATELEKSNRVGYASTYRSTVLALKRFTKRDALQFAELTPSKLEAFDKHLRDNGCSGGGISVYMRTLRTAVRAAIKNKEMHKDLYPFETGTNLGYSLKGLAAGNAPRALAAIDMEKLKRFPFEDAPHLADSVRYFLFSYYARGMNFTDMARLKHENIQAGRITYVREKTKHKNDNKKLDMVITPELATLLKAFDGEGTTHLFPILNERHVTEKQRWTRIKKCLKKTNADLKKAAELIGIETTLTTYVARHTYATTLKRNGVDISKISESLGHETVLTTARYLEGFPSEVLDEANAVL